MQPDPYTIRPEDVDEVLSAYGDMHAEIRERAREHVLRRRQPAGRTARPGRSQLAGTGRNLRAADGHAGKATARAAGGHARPATRSAPFNPVLSRMMAGALELATTTPLVAAPRDVGFRMMTFDEWLASRRPS